MYARRKQSFVRVDVSQTAEKCLVQKQRLNTAAVAREARVKVVEAQGQRVGPHPRNTSRYFG
jgi:hypothetical protein